MPDVVGNRDDRQDRPGHRASCADRRVHVVEQLAAVGREERAELRRVERGAAADPDEAVEAVARGFRSLRDGRLVRLTDDPVVDHRLDSGVAEGLTEALVEPGLRHEPVADDERPRRAELPQVLAGLGRRAGAEHDTRGVECDDRGRHFRHRRRIASSIETTSRTFIATATRQDPATR